ncbi:type II secretion system GspH family protein [Aromatoleum diolicum]|uniref:type II secretion system GspH family protein n=1 Tax=Aromatoleum diolicum TaxID=75796 RepID=UPI001B7CED79|nr:type II secretion system GspH family protein [Aromatoleum diolicum]
MRKREHGFTYLGALFLIVLMGLALAGTGEVWSTASQRARERDLLWVGNQYAQALRRYYENSPDIKLYPLRLAELLEDQRRPTPQRHLRRLYPDPITGSREWGLILGSDGRIVGVHSLSERPTRKRSRFPPAWSDFDGVATYAEWKFLGDRAFSDAAKPGPDEASPTPGADPRKSLKELTRPLTGAGTTSPLLPAR